MEFLSVYRDPVENLIVWGALAAFGVFLAFVLAAKTASGENCHARLNRMNLLFFIPYAAAVVFFSALAGRRDLSLLADLAAGGFIYFSLHHIYLMALMGLAKKSVSVNILDDIGKLAAGAGTAGISEDALLEHETAKISYIRENRLGQMLALGMARKTGAEYRITRLGSFLNRLGNAILKFWNLRRA